LVLEGFCSDPANASEDGFERPAAFGIGETDFAGTADFRAVIPALEEGEMTLAGRWRRRIVWRPEGSEDGIETGFEETAGEFCGDGRSLRG
jgi:hypothetical protein